MTIQKTEEEIIEEFNMFDDWTSKYEYIIDLGKSLPLIDEKYKDELHKIKGCQSQVWLNAVNNNGKISYTADSDAIITKGLIALLIRVLSDRTPDEIQNSELTFLDKIGLKEHLSPTRSNGLVSMVNTMKSYAKQFSNQN